LNTFGQEGVVLGPVMGALGEMSNHVDLLADVIADALTAEHLSYYGAIVAFNGRFMGLAL